MRELDLGIDKEGKHDGNLTALESDCMAILGKGGENTISSKNLTRTLEGKGHGVKKRDIRVLINHLIITHSIPVIWFQSLF